MDTYELITIIPKTTHERTRLTKPANKHAAWVMLTSVTGLIVKTILFILLRV